jgi:ribosome biogenesis GTPase / thiamine phosphate phosphatase
LNTRRPTLADLGFGRMGEIRVPEGSAVGRVVSNARGHVEVVTEHSTAMCSLTGRFKHQSRSIDMPTVGDWVIVRPGASPEVASIQALVPRRTLVARKVAGDTTDAQPLAANVDVLIIAMAYGSDFNLRRLERFLAMAFESGAEAVVALTKADTVSPEERDVLADQVRAIGGISEVVPVSSVSDIGLDTVRVHMGWARTIAIVGSSGVGKSTLVNRLAGAVVMATGDVRNDGRGRHTTKHRQLLVLSDGTLFIDTPGLRELQLWDADAGMAEAFADIAAVAESCHFSDCRHNHEPGCAVKAAVGTGTLDASRVEGWKKLTQELSDLATRQVERERQDRKIRRR